MGFFKEEGFHKLTLDVRTGIIASSLCADDKRAVLEFLRHLLISSKKYCEVHALLSRCGPIFSQEHQEMYTKINDYRYIFLHRNFDIFTPSAEYYS